MTQFNIKKINTIIIHVTNLEKSIHFYKNVLHLRDILVDNGMAYFSVGEGEESVSVMLHISDIAQPVDKGIAVDLLVDDVIAAISSIREAGGDIVQEPIDREWGVREAVIADPDGYKIWLIEPLV